MARSIGPYSAWLPAPTKACYAEFGGESGEFDGVGDVACLGRIVAIGVADAAPGEVRDRLGGNCCERRSQPIHVVKRAGNGAKPVADTGQPPRIAVRPQQRTDLVSMRHEILGQIRSEKAGCAGQEDLHRLTTLPMGGRRTPCGWRSIALLTPCLEIITCEVCCLGAGHFMSEDAFSPRSSGIEKDRRSAFLRLFENTPIPKSELVYSQLSVFLSRQELSRMMALSDIYRQHVVEANGSMIEFGTCYGRTAALPTNLRGILEPYNFTRRLIVFDTFEGLKGTEEKDGTDRLAVDGAYSAGAGYEDYLKQVLSYHELEAPIAHIPKFELVKGDASETVPAYFEQHPETIVSLVYFDFDIYKPTRDALTAIRPRLTRASVLVFDQLNCPEYPGETIALAEAFGLNNCTLRRSPLTPWMSYMTFDG